MRDSVGDSHLHFQRMHRASRQAGNTWRKSASWAHSSPHVAVCVSDLSPPCWPQVLGGPRGEAGKGGLRSEGIAARARLSRRWISWAGSRWWQQALSEPRSSVLRKGKKRQLLPKVAVMWGSVVRALFGLGRLDPAASALGAGCEAWVSCALSEVESVGFDL